MTGRQAKCKEMHMSVALITGASRGLGRALARELADRGWFLILDARGHEDLEVVVRQLDPARTVGIAGDVTDPSHRAELAAAVASAGGLDLLVNNASHLGPSPQPVLRDYPLDELARVYAVDVLAPLAVTQLMLPSLVASGGVVVNVSSDAAVEAYEGWGGYGSAKAALDHVTAVLGVEEPKVSAYSFDPGDMRTTMHQQAFPAQDISDRPEPESVVPALLRLVDERPPSGRYRAAALTASVAVSR
jgi:NAD(P)-dependent dehydrogenase (short-subunit alcohol dehydrogenase family)